MDDREAFGKVIEALRPWLGSLVIVGGWAHQLHHLLPGAISGDYAALRTRDADIAFSAQLAIDGRIDDALRAADFRLDISGDDIPPISRFGLGDADEGFYVEFLAPLIGSPVDREGRPRTTLERGGVTAQTLRYVDLLLLHPSVVHLGTNGEIPLREPAAVHVANPGCFLAQRLLIHDQRTRGKRAQDALYMYDTIQLFGARLDQLEAFWKTELSPRVPEPIKVAIDRSISKQFGTVTDDIRSATRIPADRTIDPEELRRATHVGLTRIFGGA